MDLPAIIRTQTETRDCTSGRNTRDEAAITDLGLVFVCYTLLGLACERERRTLIHVFGLSVNCPSDMSTSEPILGQYFGLSYYPNCVDLGLIFSLILMVYVPVWDDDHARRPRQLTSGYQKIMSRDVTGCER